MTARTPLESMEAPSDESLEPTSSRQEPRKEGSSTDDRANNGAGIHSSSERGEASLSRTLEAILSKTDDDEAPLTDETGEIAGIQAGARKGLGSHTLLGGSIPQDSQRVLPRVGALVEGPAFHPYLSGRDNLRRLDAVDRTADPGTASHRIAAAIERVGLSAAATKPSEIRSGARICTWAMYGGNPPSVRGGM